ncbi:RHS repeat domain-containing protein [Pseudoxanthomonas winnipegensis]|uniref:RHS repeat protein n=1 Tax=Pseudoxanthomonas winnipegensis TaxID=2480810 RepID=A0A4Q8M6N5_9GAMM|nr:RHS repeat domain-containing protein [uncultured Pseudoxanthomonas sp.]TAA43489.1 RHS repeat protein [Pseudoxanthomonas winnipegensis]
MVFVFLSSGGVVPFVKSADGSWISQQSDVVGYELVERFNSDGSFSGWRLRAGSEADFFDSKGHIAAIERNGILQVSIGRNPMGEPTSLVSPNGRSAVIHYSGYMKVDRIERPDGGVIVYGYDASNRLISVSVDGATTSYSYEDNASTTNIELTEKLDETGALQSSFSYDDTGRAITTQSTSGLNRYALNYDDTGDHVTVTTPLGSARDFYFDVYNNGRRLTKATATCSGCISSETTYGYGENGLLSAVTRNGSTTTYERDSKGRVISKTEGTGTSQARLTETSWNDAVSLPASISYRTGGGALINNRIFEYNDRGQPVKVTQSDSSGSSRVVATAYCEAGDLSAGTCPLLGLVKSVSGPRTDTNDATTFTYRMLDDASCVSAPTTCLYRKGDLWKVTDALGHVTETLSYDGAGRPLSVKDPNGVITDYEYHPRGWLTATKVRGADSSTESDDRITRIDYWPTGLVKRVTQPDGAFTAYTYDAAHRLTDVSDNAGNTIHYALDNAGNRIAEDTKDANGNLKRTLSRVYNQLGQLATQADAVGNPTDYGYDANGNTTSATDALSRVTQSEYDSLNRLKRTLQDVGGIAAETKFAYDALDNLTEVTDPKGLKTTYTYNGLGDLTKQVSPDTGTTLFTYDSAGNRITQKDARSKTTTYSYDALNRLTGIAYANTSFNVTYTYDANQSVCTAAESFPVGRLTKMQDGSGTTQYCYNRFGDLTRKVQTVNGVALTLRYTYAPGGQLTAMTYPDGAVVDYVRDSQGRITEVGVKPNGGVRQVLLTGASYHPFGPAAGWTYGNGRQMTRTLDLDYRQAAIHDASTGGLSVGFNYDEVGNLVELTQPGSTLPQVGFGYDALGRLTQSKDGPTGTVIDGYGYDKTGNRTSLTTAAGTSTYSYPTTSHRLTNVGGIARTYDAAGNTTGINGTAKQFVYDDTGRMSSVKAGGTTTRNYKYNGKGERVRSYLSTANTYTLYDEAGHWIGDYGANGTPVQQAIWMDDLPVGLRTAAAGAVSYIEPDHLGSPRVVIDPVGNTAIWKWDIKGEAFGATAPEQDPDGNGTAFNLDMRFPGQQYDSATGLAYNYFRDYESVTGRYVHSDPIGLYGGLSTYGYAGHSPLLSLDRLGLQITFPVPVESPIFLPRPTPTPVDPVLMPMSPPSDIPYVTYEDPSTGTREQCPGPCEGLLRQLREHERKLREYRSDPMKYDNKGFLRNAPPNIKENIIDGRIRNLENQINNFRKQYMDCLAKNGGTIA